MESGNSSSMQSSSGGGVGVGVGGDEQEYESNAGNNNCYFFGSTTSPPRLPYPSSLQQFMFSTSNPQQPPPSQNQSYLDTLGDHSNYQNIMFWQQPQQQQPLPQQQQQQLQQQQQHVTTTTTTTNHPLPPSVKPSTSSGSGKGAASGSGQKNPRKRTRASRRAPTTVLTTDTTNFRAMVQEFTGIPSSPFTTAASPLLTRLFTGSGHGGAFRAPGLGPGSGSGSVSGGGHLERLLAGYSTSNFPFRPSAHKPLMNTSTNTNTNTNTNTIQSLLQPGVISSLYSPGSHFQDLSGILGNQQQQQQMFLSSTEANLVGGSGSGYPLPPRMASGDGGGGGSGWQDASSNDGLNNVGNIGTTSDVNNNDGNQQMEGTRIISGSGTSNYDHNHLNNSNLNVISSRDVTHGSNDAAQGTLGDFLD